MKTVIEMAREAGVAEGSIGVHDIFTFGNLTLERFADLVREDEREACAIRSNPVNDEIIAELWHKSGGHLHRFARLLEQFMAAI